MFVHVHLIDLKLIINSFKGAELARIILCNSSVHDRKKKRSRETVAMCGRPAIGFNAAMRNLAILALSLSSFPFVPP